jgi:hypothetical protein
VCVWGVCGYWGMCVVITYTQILFILVYWFIGLLVYWFIGLLVYFHKNFSLYYPIQTTMDTSWITEEKKLVEIRHNCLPEPLTSIQLKIFYVDMSQSLDTIETKTISLASSNHISKEQLISLIQTHKKESQMNHYVFKEMSLFHIPIEPEQISTFLQPSFESQSFFHTYSIVQDIDLLPSVFIFHPSSTLCLLFVEHEKPAVKKLKSALKSSSVSTSENGSRRITKRVRIKAPRHTRHAK